MTEHDKGTFFVVSQLDSGECVAYSEHEPIFCFIRKSEQEAVSVAVETFEEYERLFRQRTVRARAEQLVPLPVRRISHDKRAYSLAFA